MEATVEEMRQIVEQHDLMCPECGTGEASFAAFQAWHALVKYRASDVTHDGKPVPLGAFDVESLLGMFDQDLRAYAAKLVSQRHEGRSD